MLLTGKSLAQMQYEISSGFHQKGYVNTALRKLTDLHKLELRWSMSVFAAAYRALVSPVKEETKAGQRASGSAQPPDSPGVYRSLRKRPNLNYAQAAGE